jgi:sugar phosphate isomerase/epimerase
MMINQVHVRSHESADLTSMGRRNFLAAGVAAVAGRTAFAAGRWKMRLSTSSVMFNLLPVEEAVARIASLGFEGVDFWQGEDFRVKHLEEAADRLGPDGLKRLLAKHKLKLCSFTCFYIPIDRYAEMLGKAGGGQGFVIRESRYYGRGKSGGAVRTTDLGELGKQMRSVIESLQPQLELADKYNFRIAIENHSSALLNSMDSFKVFLELANHPRLGIALAPYHLQAAGVPVEDVIAQCGKRILYFYAWQNEQGVNQLPGFGSADFTPWLAALARSNYAGWVNPFMHGENLPDKMAPDEMAKALAKSKSYLEQRRAKI